MPVIVKQQAARKPAGGGSSYNPLALTWHRVIWADDSSWVNPGDGNAVAQWDDASGNSRHFTQTDATKQPLFRSSVAALNNRAAVHFDGTNDVMDGAFASMSQPWSAFAVVNLTKTASSTVFDVGGGSTTRGLQTTSGSVWQLSYGITVSTGMAATTGGHVLYTVANGTSSFLDLNGTSSALLDAGTSAANSPRLGARGTGPFEPLGGHIAFLGIKNSALSSTDLADLEAWASDYYGITVA